MIKQIIIKTSSKASMASVMLGIHEQLKGNIDYVNSNIVLNDSSARRDNTENEVHVYIMNDATIDIPIIVL